MNNNALFLSLGLLLSGAQIIAMGPTTPAKVPTPLRSKTHLSQDRQDIMGEMKLIGELATNTNEDMTGLINLALELSEAATDWAAQLDRSDTQKLKIRASEVTNQIKSMYKSLGNGMLLRVNDLRAQSSKPLTRSKRQLVRVAMEIAINDYNALVANAQNLGIENFNTVLDQIQARLTAITNLMA